MFKKLSTGLALALALTAGSAHAAGGEAKVTDYDFGFEGFFGSYDESQLQRGLQVYTEICSSCHGLKFVPLRTLGDNGGPHFSKAEVRAYASQNFEVFDQTLFDGEGDFRPALPTDNFPAVTSAAAPDLSLMAKARAGFHGPEGTGLAQLFKGMGGPEYIASLLMGYEDPPSCAPDDMDGNYNTVFTAGGYPEECKDEDGNHKYPGSWIGMGQPLWGDDVEYADGADASQEAISKDVAAFLMWTAEPKLNDRKKAGFVGILILGLLAFLLYFTNKSLWKPIKYRDEA